MTDLAIRVENLSTRYCIGPREPYRARRDVITDVFAAPFRHLRENSQFEIRNVFLAAYCLLPSVFWSFAIRNVLLAAFCLLPTEALQFCGSVALWL